MVVGTFVCSMLAFANPGPNPGPSLPTEAQRVDAAEHRGFSVALDSAFSLMGRNFGASSTFRLAFRRKQVEVFGVGGVTYGQWTPIVGVEGTRSIYGPTRTRTQASNAMLGVRWVEDSPGRRHHWYLGFSLVVPTDIDGETAHLQEVLGEETVLRYSGWDAWLWLPGTTSVALPFGWRWNGDRGLLGVDAAIAGTRGVRGQLGVSAQMRWYAALSIRRSLLGVYASIAGATANADAVVGGGGVFFDTPMCRRGRASCPVNLSLTAGASAAHSSYGMTPGMVSVGAALRWGSSSKRE